jgi:hypothetical protein
VLYLPGSVVLVLELTYYPVINGFYFARELGIYRHAGDVQNYPLSSVKSWPAALSLPPPSDTSIPFAA